MPKDTPFWNAPIEKLEEALNIKRQIAALEARLIGLFGNRAQEDRLPSAQAPSAPRRRRGQLSAAGRANIIAAQKARWAAKKSAIPAAKPATAKSRKKRGGLTATGRKKLSDAMRARWAARKKGGRAPNAKA